MPGLRHLVIVSSALTAALFALAPAATASTGPAMTRAGAAAAPAAGGSNEFFNSDSCAGSTFCMAIGNYTLNGHTPALSEVLTGGHWVVRHVRSPAHGINTFANEVSCASAARCLFVGDHFAGQQGPSANLAEAWNGRSWHIITTTGPAGAAFSLLTDVACPTTSFCLVVGQAGSTSHAQATAYTWRNRTTWRGIAVPHPRHARSSDLSGVACVDASRCMAVGDYTSARGVNLPFAARWHEGQWKLLTTPAVRKQRLTTFQAISCPSATLCVAVGNTEDHTRSEFFHAFAEVWNGRRWSVSTLRRPPSLFLGTSCPALNRCFASGYTFPSGSHFAHPLIETWNGRFWTIQHSVETSAPRSGDILPHVSCSRRTDCEVVGFSFRPRVANSDRTLAEMWNGHRWKIQATTNP